MQKFKDLGLSASIVEALAQKGFETPTPIQEQVIPILLEGKNNVVGQAQTGTGKTAAFGLPIVQNLKEKTNAVQALILTPTRELALQVANEIVSFKGDKKLFITTVYGGQSIDRQIRDLNRGTDIVVGTPGRVIDLIKRNKLKLENIKYFVLDEADEMLNMGFIDDIEFIINQTNEEKQVLLFSATMPKKIMSLAKKYMGDYELVQVKKEQITTTNVEQLYYAVYAKDKMKVLKRILEVNPNFYGIIFCNTKMGTDDVTRQLNQLDYSAEALHGDIAQNQRERILSRFKSKSCTILCATDVAARGIDVDDLTHVINYQLPQDPEQYVHRIGRTGRAGKEGVAISLISGSEKKQLKIIESIAKTSLHKAELPSADELIEAKLTQLYLDIASSVVDKKDEFILELANQLLESNDPKTILTSALKYFLKDELTSDYYDDIKMPKTLAGSTNKETRLFIAKGKKDSFNKDSLEDYIVSKSHIDKNAFLDTYLLENFSFITLQDDDAEMVLRAFKTIKNNGKSLVVKAKGRDGDSSSSSEKSGRKSDRKGRKSSKKGKSNSGNAHSNFFSKGKSTKSKYKNAKY
ncbi:MAG: DEAD/DEAH box helicase [Chitinophagales bacterium]|nr:DEAD/DEAH box helicase [Chitinophagales bacterium]